MKTILSLLIAGLAAIVMSQGAPVSQAEAGAIFVKANLAIKTVLGLKTAPPVFAPGSGIATREQVLKQFAALYDYTQAKFKFTATKRPSVPGVISFKDPQTKQLAIRLETLGFVDRYGPLVTAKSDGMSTQEFGDALGYFLARLAELSHLPSSRFSPYLMPG